MINVLCIPFLKSVEVQVGKFCNLKNRILLVFCEPGAEYYFCNFHNC